MDRDEEEKREKERKEDTRGNDGHPLKDHPEDRGLFSLLRP